MVNNTFSQDQRIADSLTIIYEEKGYDDSSELEILRQLSFNEVNDLQKSLNYAEKLIALANEKNDVLFLHRGYLQKGSTLRLLGDLEQALDAFFKSSDAANAANYQEGEGAAYMAIADIYSVYENKQNAMLYYNKSIKMLRETSDSVTLATALLNAGDEYLNIEMYDSALLYFNESGIIFEKVDYLIGTAYNLGNMGMVYAEQGKDDLAEANINEAISVLEKLQDYYPISVYLTYMSDIYFKKRENRKAINYAQRSLQLAQQYGLKEQISDANLKLSELYEKTDELDSAYKYYKNHIIYRDSLKNLSSIQQMADMRTNFEVSRKQIEVDLLNEQKRNQRIIMVAIGVIAFLILILAAGLFHRFTYIRKTNIIIEEEKNRSESLLLNILPEETALELKANGSVQTKKFESATVLFTDFKGFTKLAEMVEPEQLIKSIDFYFKAFDEIISKYGLEKIKTIGDAYMCAGGLPTENTTHASDVASAAKELLNLVDEELKANDDIIHFEVRIGIHTGPVVAGIVGNKKWQYDIWGDTVNIASRMESSSMPGKINLSESTYHEIKDLYPCNYRGQIQVKNHGPVNMYFLS